MPSQTDYTPPPMRPLALTVAEACAKVDAWGSEQQFGVHTIARVLRAEVERLTREVERRMAKRRT